MSEPTPAENASPRRGGDIDLGSARQLERWMMREIPDHAGPVWVDRFPGGQSNPTFRLETPRRNYVLRRKPPGKLLRSAHAIEREYQVMAALGPLGFPVPKTFGICEDTSVIGSPFFLMELVEGRILWDPTFPEMTPSERRAIYDAQIDTLAALHRIDPVSAGLSEFGRPGNYFARQIARWSKQYRASNPPADEKMEKLMVWLADTVPPETKPCIVHGDFRIDNMVLKKDAPEVVAVLDWELSTLGDPIADLTYFLMMWRAPAGERISLHAVDFDTSGIPTMDDALDRYLSRSGRVLERPIYWYIAFNLFRLAAILQGVAGRAAKGQANNERALMAQERVSPLALAAWDNAREAGAPA